MNRRTFVKCSATGGLILAAAPAAVISGCNESWIAVVLNDIPVVVNVVNSILSVVSIATGNGLIGSAVAAIITEAVTALAAALTALKDAIDAYNANPAGGLSAVIDALKKAQQDANAVMASLPAGTLSATWQLVVIAGLGTVVMILSAIQTLVPGAAPVGIRAKITAQAAAGKLVLPNAAAIQTGFNAVLLLHGFEGAIK